MCGSLSWGTHLGLGVALISALVTAVCSNSSKNLDECRISIMVKLRRGDTRPESRRASRQKSVS
jgi:hypothetical protein